MSNDLRTIEELAADARKAVMEACKLVEQRRSKLRAADLITDATMALALLSQRVQASGDFSERRARHVEEDELSVVEMATNKRAVATMLDVFDDADVRVSCEDERQAAALCAAGEDGGAARMLKELLRAAQLRVLQAMIAYIWHSAASPWEMMKRALAITRRYARSEIRGITMTQVATLLGEKSRCAAVSARERDIHDTLLVSWGVRAPKAADGGLKGPETCEKNRVRAMGNQNRRGKTKFRATAHVGSPDTTKPNNHSRR